MKKFLNVILLCMVIFTLTGCKNENTSANGSAVDSVSGKKIDLDLSGFSTTMAYSELYNITAAPDEYLGQTIRLKGNFNVYHDEATDKYYYACIIADSAACCSAALEFVPEENLTYPNDFPELESEITVMGTLETYEENGTKYCHLVNAQMS